MKADWRTKERLSHFLGLGWRIVRGSTEASSFLRMIFPRQAEKASHHRFLAIPSHFSPATTTALPSRSPQHTTHPVAPGNSTCPSLLSLQLSRHASLLDCKRSFSDPPEETQSIRHRQFVEGSASNFPEAARASAAAARMRAKALDSCLLDVILWNLMLPNQF